MLRSTTLGLGLLLASFVTAGAAAGCSTEQRDFTSASAGAGAGGPGSGGGSTGGGATTCSPGTTEACYSGPDGTKGVGACKEGSRTCKPDGTGFGDCAGEVVPTAEDCSGNDTSCDGKGCSGDPLWAHGYGDDAFQLAIVASPTPEGGVVVGGAYSGTINFGGAQLVCFDGPNNYDAFLLSLDKDGKHVWSASYGSIGQQIMFGVAVGANGDVAVAGPFENTIDFGGEPLTSAGNTDVFVAKLDAMGKRLWSKAYGDANQQQALSVAMAPNGDVAVVGLFNTTIDFDGITLIATGAGADAFLALLDGKTGKAKWAKSFGDTSDDIAYAVAADASGIVIAGQFTGQANFGAGPILAVGPSSNLFVAAFDLTGKYRWAHGAGDPGGGYVAAQGIAVGPTGGAVVVGNLSGSVDFGNGPITASSGAFAARWNADGTPSWSKGYPSTGSVTLQHVAIDGADNAVAAGEFVTDITIGAKVLTSAGGGDAVAIKISGKDGSTIHANAYGDDKDQLFYGAAVDTAGDAFLVGGNFGTMTLGVDKIGTSGDYDVIVAKVAP